MRNDLTIFFFQNYFFFFQNRSWYYLYPPFHPPNSKCVFGSYPLPSSDSEITLVRTQKPTTNMELEAEDWSCP